MGYGEGYMTGKLVGALCGAFVGVLLILFMNKDRRFKCRYDERQELIRGKSFKYAFYALIACLVTDIMFGELLDQVMARDAVGMLYLCIGVIVLSVHGILNDGYFSLNDNPKRVVTVFLTLFLMNFAGTLFYIFNGLLVKNGKLTDRVINLMCAVTLLIIVLVMLVKTAGKKQQEEG